MIQEQLKAAFKQAALEITEQTGAQRLAKSLMDYPARIQAQQEVVALARRAVDDAKAQVEQLRAIFVAAVTVETNGNGKPRFSNEKAREAEVIKRMTADQECMAARQALQDAENGSNAAYFDLQRLENEFRATVKAADLVAAQLNLLAGGGQ